MRKIAVVLLILLMLIQAAWAQPPKGLLRHVQVFTGTAPSTTASTQKHAVFTENLANTIPAATLPFAMTQWTPQTRTGEDKCVSPYYYNDPWFRGIRATHWLSGSCVADYGSFTLMPFCGDLRTDLELVKSPHKPSELEVSPSHLQIELPAQGLSVALVPTLHGAMGSMMAQQGGMANLLILPNTLLPQGSVRINRRTGCVELTNPARRIYQGWGQPAGFSGYLVLQPQQAWAAAGVFTAQGPQPGDTASQQMGVGAYLRFATKASQTIQWRMATSFTSIEEAYKNMAAELPDWRMGNVQAQATNNWENLLSQAVVHGGAETDKQVFYTAVYHAALHPRLFSDASGRYPRFAQQYATGVLPKGESYYCDFPMWDIHRAQLPLWMLLRPQLVNQFAKSYVRKGQQGGWMPIFPCWNSYTAAMIGDHEASFLAACYAKGIRGFDVKEAYRLLRRNAFEQAAQADYLDGKGRRGLASYLRHGYLPLEDSVWEAFHKREQVSRTLEYAFNDHSLALLAAAVGQQADAQALLQRGKNYERVFDRERRSMNGRYASGQWFAALNPDEKHNFITEGTPRHYSFYVPHDPRGLQALYGGATGLEAALDSLFAKDQYWHGNEPCHGIAFLYNYTPSPWKTGRVVHRILSEEYSAGASGLSGNDDAGQMSAWYVFAALGLYPMNPAADHYELFAPKFNKAVLRLPGGKTLTITTQRSHPQATQVQSVRLNGKLIHGLQLAHKQLLQGGHLLIRLTLPPTSNSSQIAHHSLPAHE